MSKATNHDIPPLSNTLYFFPMKTVPTYINREMERVAI